MGTLKDRIRTTPLIKVAVCKKEAAPETDAFTGRQRASVLYAEDETAGSLQKVCTQAGR